MPARVPHIDFFLEAPRLLCIVQLHLNMRVKHTIIVLTYHVEVILNLFLQCLLGGITIYLVRCRVNWLLVVERHGDLLFTS